MIGQAVTAARLLSGRWTPFLVPWTGEEIETHEARGGNEAIETLASRIGESSRRAHVFPTVSGREAIYAALKALAGGGRRKVIIPSFACRGVVDPVIAAELTPMFCDIDDNLNLSAASIGNVVDADCLAIIVPHTCGVWNGSIDAIMSSAKGAGAWVVEDAAQALGLEHGGRPAGSVGDCAIFSTGLGKLIFAHGGGAAATSDRVFAQRLSALPWTEFAGDEVALVKRWRERLRSPSRRGLSAVSQRLGLARSQSRAPHDADAPEIAREPRRMTVRMAKTALAQFNVLSQMLARRRKNAERWIELIDGARWPHEWRTAPLDGAVQLKFWLDVPASLASRLQLHFWRNGVEVETLYVPLHLQQPYSGFPHGELTRTERLAGRVFSLPVRPGLDEHDFRRIETAVRTWRP